MSESLEHLFDAELHYVGGSAVAYRTDEGDLIGSGAGTVRGPKLSGTIRWSFYAAECAFDPSGAARATGDSICRTAPGGLLELDDGAKVWFEARGFGMRRTGRPTGYPQWR